MKHKIAASIFILSIVTFGQSSLLAQASGQPKFGTWDAVKGIPYGEKVGINLKAGRTVKGEIASVSDSGITIGRDSSAVTAGRDEVRRVYRMIEKSPRKSVLIGALVGAAIGAGGTVNIARTGEVTTDLALLPLVGAATGALLGLAFGSRDKRILIYEIQ